MHSISGNEIYSTVKAICNFGSRYMGSDGAAKAQDYILSQLEEIGLETERQSFNYLSYTPYSTLLHIDREEIACEPLANTAFTKKSMTAPLIYCGAGTQEEISRLQNEGIDLSGSILVSDNLRSFIPYTAAEAAGAVGLVLATTLPDNTIRCGSGRLDRKAGTIPGLSIGGEDGRRIISQLQSGKKIEAVLQTDGRMDYAEGENIVGRSSSLSGSRILLSAHYDSLWNGVHAMDNAAGVATVIELTKNLSRLEDAGFECAMFGGEELGLWGSAGYVERNQKELSQINAVINLDTVGSDLSKLEVGVTADIRPLCQAVTDQMAITVDCWNTPPRPGSDQKHFADRKIPSIWIANCGSDLRYHTPLDIPAIISPERLQKTAEVALEFFKQLKRSLT